MAKPLGSGITIAVIAAVVMGGLFAVFGGLAHGYTLRNIGLLFSSGALIGAMSGPELEPKAFRFPTLWQVITCAFGFIAGAIYFRASPEGVALAALVGIILGYLAPYWLKHVQIP